MRGVLGAVMADVFVSYAREELARADEVRKALEALGLSVFLDVERLDSGDVWSDVIDRELKAAGAVVALWSPHALSRPWVKKECAVAQGRGVLLPALLEPVTDLDMPTQFSDLHRDDLTDFQGQLDHPGWRKLVRALAKKLKRNDLLAAQIAALKEEKQTAKVKAELEVARAELGKLRKSKGGVKPAVIVAFSAAVLAVAGIGVWLGGAKLVAWAAKECAGGMPICVSTGVWYEHGLFVPKQKARAAELYRVGCDNGEEMGCTFLAMMYDDGDGVAKDDPRALELYTRACKGGETTACFNAAVMHENGEGAPKAVSEAVAFYALACKGGDADGCVSAGNLTLTPQASPEDVDQATNFFRKACDLNNQPACDWLNANAQAAVH